MHFHQQGAVLRAKQNRPCLQKEARYLTPTTETGKRRAATERDGAPQGEEDASGPRAELPNRESATKNAQQSVRKLAWPPTGRAWGAKV